MSSSSTDRVVRADNGQRNELANALRALAMDAVQKANSGHPGAPMGMAEMALALAASDVTGVFNTAGAEVVSRLEFSRQIAQAFGLDARLMDPITTAQLGQAAPRPLKAGLLMDKFRATFPELPILGPAEGLQIVKRQFEQAGLI